MRDVLAKMRECGKEAKMRDFPHDCGTVDTYAFINTNYKFTVSSTFDRINTLSAKDGDLRLSESNACLPKTEISVTMCVFHIHMLQTTYVHIA